VHGYLKPGWQRRYRTGAVLTTNSKFDPNDPFWIVATDKSMIESHNDIEEPVFVDFIRQLNRLASLLRLFLRWPEAGRKHEKPVRLIFRRPPADRSASRIARPSAGFRADDGQGRVPGLSPTQGGYRTHRRGFSSP
jgi:hypothetical protein